MKTNPLFNIDYQLELARSQAMSLLSQLAKLSGFLLLVLVILLRNLSMFPPLLYVVAENPGAARFITVLSGLYFAWTMIYVGFLQKPDTYTVVYGDVTESVSGNKTVIAYLLAVLVYLVVYVIEQILGVPDTAFLIICAFIQLLPLFMGESFKEQSENLMPFLANMALVVVSAYILAIGA